MAPKRIKGAISAEQQKTVFSEVEKAFYELQLADGNRKLARLRAAVGDYEVRNEELQKAYDRLDEDRADIIAYLKKTLTVKTDENTELKDKVKALEELRVIETAEFKLTVNELENNFTKMKDQLTSENKLLAGKLNTLEEFKAIREDLMKKFEKQERAFEDQEMKYKRIIYETETKFVIGKDKLKKEMEERLLQLAQQFQDASELRIAASTHRVIRENIALNNQLDSLLLTQAKVAEQNEKFKEDERASYCAKEAAEEERDKAMNKSIVQLKVIDQLTAAFEDVRKLKAFYEKKQFDTEKHQTSVRKLTKENKKLLLQVRILEQNLHAYLGEQNKSVVETAKLLRERETFKNILRESAFAVQASLKLDHWSTLDPSREIMDREIVLKGILKVINQYHDAARAESMESLVSLSNIYEKGDLGFDVKPVLSRRSQAMMPGLTDTLSLQSFEDKRSAISASPASSKESIRTVPSVQLIPVDEEPPPTPKDSLLSFTVTSLHSSMASSTAEGEEDEDDITEISKLLAISKVEMQRSLMADLAMSHISRRRMSLLESKSRLDIVSQKSGEAIHEKGESDIEGEQHKTMPEEVESEPVQDEGVPVQDEGVPVQDEGVPVQDEGEPTQDEGEPTQDESEPTQDIDEPVTVDEAGDEEDKKKDTSAE